MSALVGWSATAALTAYAQRRPGVAAIAWLIASLGITVGLSAAVIGALFDFGELTFRLLQLGVSLLGPVYMAWGAFEYAVRVPNARFTSRLFLSVFTIVPIVVLAVDRLSGRFGSSFPPLAEHYDLIPRVLVNSAQIFAAVLLVTALVAAARRGTRGRGRTDLAVLGLLALATLLAVLVGRMGLDVMGPSLMLGAVSALWGAGALAARPRRDVYDDDDDDYFEDEYDDMDDELDDPQEEPVRRKRRKADPYDDLYGDPPSNPATDELRGVITIYTLAEGRGEGFDQLANAMVAEVAAREPDTLLFASHTVPSAPLQRIVYAIYRDEPAQEEHEQQPHTMEFTRHLSGYVVATNVIELSLSGAAASDGLAAMLPPR
ncbi:putative quinol monooxygenase [Nocardiopsis alkaliphila]|uniref:putative quinol monooxygenase n=1 Tax=Nocardiopsis alkaliphila TaxID=225762 RepID=UPI000348D855|nr:membrane protein [Nocardiopsis alkaliphila]